MRLGIKYALPLKLSWRVDFDGEVPTKNITGVFDGPQKIASWLFAIIVIPKVQLQRNHNVRMPLAVPDVEYVLGAKTLQFRAYTLIENLISCLVRGVGTGIDSDDDDAAVAPLVQRDEVNANPGYWWINQRMNFVLKPSLQTIFDREVHSFIRFNGLIGLWVETADHKVAAGVIRKCGNICGETVGKPFVCREPF